MKDFLMKTVEYTAKGVIVVVFILAILVGMPFMIIAECLDKRRIKR